MNKIKNYAIIYGRFQIDKPRFGRNVLQNLTCTCGNHEVLKTHKVYEDKNRYYDYDLKEEIKCSKCNAQVIEYIDEYHTRDSVLKITDNIVHKLVANDEILELEKERIDIELVRDKTTLNYQALLKKRQIFTAYMNYQDDVPIKLYENDELITNSQTNIQRVFSFVDLSQLKDCNNNMYYEVFKIMPETAASKVILNLLKYPQLEIFYNTYHTLDCIKTLPFNYFKKGNSPSEILNVPKSVWNNLNNLQKRDDYKNNILGSFDKILKLIELYPKKIDIVNKIINNTYALKFKESFDSYVELIQFGLDIDILFKYLTEDIYTYQGIDSPIEGLQLLYDYVKTSVSMNIQYEKYPKSLKLRHDLTSKNYRLNEDEILSKQFELVVNSKNYTNLVYNDKSYSVVKPNCMKDVINEGKQLSHCVGSYIDRIRNQETKILFLRKSNDLKKSLITLEVRNGKLKQASGFSCRKPDLNESKFIKKWIKRNKLNISCYLE